MNGGWKSVIVRLGSYRSIKIITLQRTRRISEDFRDMVNFCIERAVQSGFTSYAKLRKLVYEE